LRLRPTAASDLPAGFEVTEAGGLIGAAWEGEEKTENYVIMSFRPGRFRNRFKIQNLWLKLTIS
jgi:hypothetical protein